MRIQEQPCRMLKDEEKSVKTCKHVEHTSNPILTKINQNPQKHLKSF